MPPNAIGGVGFGGNKGTIPLATVAMELGVWGPTFSKLLSSMIARNGGTEAEWLGERGAPLDNVAIGEGVGYPHPYP